MASLEGEVPYRAPRARGTGGFIRSASLNHLRQRQFLKVIKVGRRVGGKPSADTSSRSLRCHSGCAAARHE